MSGAHDGPERGAARQVPILVTLDVHPVPGMGQYILATLDEFRRLGVRATFFFTMSVLEENAHLIERLLAEGHQIASHGLLHNSEPMNGYPPERYDLLAEPDQRRFIDEATAKAQSLLGRRPTVFRSPCFGISGTTVRLLEEYGYAADFSVNSQRLDALTANPFGCNNLLAPRLPYHPSRDNPFRRGDSALWEIPLSAFILPFAVMTLITFRVTLTRLFFSMLYRESRRTGKPIVYMVHPEEFSPEGSTYTIPLRELRPKDFLPLKGRGIRARQAIRMGDPKKIHRCNLELFESMREFDDVRFVTADEYIAGWLG